ncbi:hypothetical protein JCM8547_005881 [Rhodosporidiobolus lusitaniae]
MPSTQEELFLMQAERMGLPPAMIAQAKRDPQLLECIRSKLSGLSLPQPVFEEGANTIEGLRRQLDAAKQAYAREKNRPLRKPAAGNRSEYIVGCEAQRESIIKTIQENETETTKHMSLLTTFTGVPKSFSDTPLSTLRRSTFLSCPTSLPYVLTKF